MVTEEDINLALSELINSSKPNISAVAKKYNIVPSTLWRRLKGETRSRKTFLEHKCRYLTDAQEGVLLGQIDFLYNRGLHPTPRIVRNIVEELLQHPIGDGWVYRFQQRHETRIKSVYLKGYDRNRKIADNPKNIKHFYDNVGVEFNLNRSEF